MKYCSLAVITIFMGSFAHADEPANLVHVMSFNIRYGTAPDGVNRWDNRKELLVETIKTYNPDLLGTQECLASQKEYLDTKLVGYQSFGAGRDDGKQTGEMAALFYRADRFTKLDGGHFWLSTTPDKVGSLGWDAALPRVATWVKLKDRKAPNDKPILFVNTHFDHRGPKAREQSALLLRQKVSELGKGCRIVVTGDFNAGEKSGPYESMFGCLDGKSSPLIDSFRSLHREPAKQEGTFSGFKADQVEGSRIDWIGVSHDWEIRLAGIDRSSKDGRTPSDHFPVTATLRPRSDDQQTTLRVLTYNIHHGEGLDGKVDLHRIAQIIRQADPDFVAVQEVDRNTKRCGNIDEAAELARRTGLIATFGKAIDYDGGEYGQVILSRRPMTNTKVHQLPGTPDSEQRIAISVDVIIQGLPLTFVTTHLDHLSTDNRLAQVKKLDELFAKSDQITLLAGDLNATPESEPLKLLSTHWPQPASEQRLTYPADSPSVQIDYVLCGGKEQLPTITSHVYDEAVASDHRPLLVVFQHAVRDQSSVLPAYRKPTNIAHRGASGDAPEHTLTAYKLALEQGADFVEPDLRMTKDGHLLCMHDSTLERTTNVETVFPERGQEINGKNRWPISDFTLEEIQQLDAGVWKDAKYAGEKVPTFQQMIDLVRGKAGIIPETKAPEDYGKLGLNMEEALVKTLKVNKLWTQNRDTKTPIVIQSFSPESLILLREKYDCKLPLVYLFSSGNWTHHKLKEVRQYADGIAPSKKLILACPNIVQDAHSLGMSVTAWSFTAGKADRFKTVREEMRYFLDDLKVDAVFTDNPDQFPTK